MIVELSIPSEKVTEIVLFRPALAESAGEDEEIATPNMPVFEHLATKEKVMMV